MKLIIASSNNHKVQEIKDILAEHFPVIMSMKQANLELDIIEDGETFEHNAIKKAEEVLANAPEFDAALADDSGLMVDALGGAPGVYSARYSGGDDNMNNQKLKSVMKNEKNRKCKFVSAVALAQRGKPTVCTLGEVEGELLYDERGERGFGYDPLFYYEPFELTFAQMSAEQKNSVSHRKIALMKLNELLAERKED